MSKQDVVQEVDVKEAATEVPTFTLRADCRFDLQAMVMIAQMAEDRAAPERVAEIRGVLRNFEFYEERHLRHRGRS